MPKYSDEEMEKVNELLFQNESMTGKEACDRAGVHPSSYYHWRESKRDAGMKVPEIGIKRGPYKTKSKEDVPFQIKSQPLPKTQSDKVIVMVTDAANLKNILESLV